MTIKTEVVLILLQVTLKPPSLEEREYKIYRKKWNLVSDDLSSAQFLKFILNKVKIWKSTNCLSSRTWMALVFFSFGLLLNSYKIMRLAILLCFAR